MKIYWDKNPSPYKSVAETLFEKRDYYGDSIVVQLRLRRRPSSPIEEHTVLYLRTGHGNDYEWEYDWWEGEQEVELIAAAPISKVKLNEQFYF